MFLLEEMMILKLTINWTFVLILFIFFFLLLIYIVILLSKRNQKLQMLLDKADESLLKKNEKKESKIDIDREVSIQKNISLKELSDVDKTESLKIVNPRNDIYFDYDDREVEKETKDSFVINDKERKPYQKNVLNSIKAPTSPINVNNQSPTMRELKMDLNDFIKKGKKSNNEIKVITSKDYIDNKEDYHIKDKNNKDDNYMNEVSKRLEEAIDNNPIELTEYEKIQEEEAIISYQELINNKDKIYQITDDEADIEFINELKNFRESLKEK